MYIGSFKNEKANLGITYSYKRRGLDVNIYPDFKTEDENKPSYDLSGKLFTDFIGFKGPDLLYDLFDIEIKFDKAAFVDQVTLSQDPKSEIKSIEVFTKNDGKFKKVGFFKAATGKTIKDTEIEILTGVKTDNLVLRFGGLCKNIIIGNLDILGGVELENALYPLPLSMKENGGFLKEITGVNANAFEEIRAKDNFIEKYKESFGKDITENGGNITFKLSSLEEEEFTIKVDENGALIEGGSLRALLYASEKLLQLCTPSGIKTVEIHDKPFLRLRGVHFALPSRGELPFLRRLVKYLLMPLGYNTMFIEIAAGMEYKTHPEINTAWTAACEAYERGELPRPAHYGYSGNTPLTQDEVREMCAYIRSYGLKVIPEIQTFGHVQYITTAFPHLGERKYQPAVTNLDEGESKPDEYYAHCMCPNHPDYYKITFDIMDEVIDVIKPDEYVHIGHDEINTIGKCERCKDIPEQEIYAKEVTAIHDHLKEKGYKTMMWSDMIEEPIYEAMKAVDMIPKDIVCLSFTWYFHVELDIEERLYDHGFDVIMGNFYSSHYTRFDKRKYGRNLLGAEVSCWCSFSKYYHAYAGKTYDMIFSANAFWNEGFSQKLAKTFRLLANNISVPVLKGLGSHYMTENAKEVEFSKCPLCAPYDIREDFDKALKASYHEEKSISFTGKADKLSFLHATDKSGRHIMRTPAFKTGEYVISYADGEEEVIDILYGANICEYKREYALPKESDYFRHVGYIATCLANPVEGKTAEGEDYTLYEYVWKNPCPEKEIKEIKVRQTSETDEAILLFNIKAE